MYVKTIHKAKIYRLFCHITEDVRERREMVFKLHWNTYCRELNNRMNVLYMLETREYLKHVPFCKYTSAQK